MYFITVYASFYLHVPRVTSDLYKYVYIYVYLVRTRICIFYVYVRI